MNSGHYMLDTDILVTVKLPRHYGRIRRELEVAGHPIGAMDLMVAAHASALGFTLVTNNAREFNRVQGLQVENWAETEQAAK